MDNRADQALPYRNGHRMNSYSQSLATTPKNRFNFKTERPYERLILQSPTRRASGPRPQPGRQNSTASLHGANPPAEQRKTFYDGPPPDHKIRSQTRIASNPTTRRRYSNRSPSLTLKESRSITSLPLLLLLLSPLSSLQRRSPPLLLHIHHLSLPNSKPQPKSWPTRKLYPPKQIATAICPVCL
jgi:hypothetical protein